MKPAIHSPFRDGQPIDCRAVVDVVVAKPQGERAKGEEKAHTRSPLSACLPVSHRGPTAAITTAAAWSSLGKSTLVVQTVQASSRAQRSLFNSLAMNASSGGLLPVNGTHRAPHVHCTNPRFPTHSHAILSSKQAPPQPLLPRQHRQRGCCNKSP